MMGDRRGRGSRQISRRDLGRWCLWGNETRGSGGGGDERGGDSSDGDDGDDPIYSHDSRYPGI